MTSTPERCLNVVALFNETGVGRFSEAFFLALSEHCSKHGGPLRVRHYSATPESIGRLLRRQQATDTTLFFWLASPALLAQLKTRKVLWIFFESTHLPKGWIRQLSWYDEVWVPSPWAAEVLRSNGFGGCVRVVPGGVSPSLYMPLAQARDVPQRPPRILMVGKYERRKGYDVAIRALSELKRQLDYVLIAKADFFSMPERVSGFREATQRAGIPCEIVSGRLTTEEMVRLYQSCDLFLFPSRAEGFGLPCIEALACAVPTVATNYSAQQVFLSKVEGQYWSIQHEVVPLVDDETYSRLYKRDYGDEPMGFWAEPSAQSIVDGVTALLGDYPASRRRALEASDTIRREFCWDRVAETAHAHL